MTPAQLLAESRATARLLERRHMAHELACDCIAGRLADGRRCPEGDAKFTAWRAAALWANAIGWILEDEPLTGANEIAIRLPGFVAELEAMRGGAA